MNYQCLIVEKKDGIEKIILNRPQSMNALNEVLRQELLQALREAELAEDTGVVILTGAGSKAFCAGNDLKERSIDPSLGKFIGKPGSSIVEAIDDLSKPIIAAVNGFCYTGGFEIALACDMILASDNAVFADTHARFGLIHGWGGTQRLPKIVGMFKTMEIMLTSEPFSAAEAEKIGLVNKVVPADKLMETCEGIAKKILGNVPYAVKMIKTLVRRGTKMDLASGLDMENALYRWRREWATQDDVGRIKGFSEKK